MPDYYLGEVMLFPTTRTPRGFMPCQGQLIPITQNSALFSLLGTNYGGDGRTTFALPNLGGCVATGRQSSSETGQSGGVAQVTLTQATLPSHTHTGTSGLTLTQQVSTDNADQTIPAEGSYLAATSRSGGGVAQVYAPQGTTPNVTLGSLTYDMPPSLSLNNAGNSQPHDNLQPYLAMGFFICVQGVFPTRP